MRDRKAPPGGFEPLRVTSLNPVRDAKTIGHDVGESRAVSAAKATVLQRRFSQLNADGAAVAEAHAEHELRAESQLVRVRWACDAIADDLAALDSMTEGIPRRNELMREVVNELSVLADLSTNRSTEGGGWREALAALRGHAEFLIEQGDDDASRLAAIDLALERIERVEKLATEALRSYFGYISA